jgi:hypothetical protein
MQIDAERRIVMTEEKRWYIYRAFWPQDGSDNWLAKILTEQEFHDQGHKPNTLLSCPWMVFIGDEPTLLQWQQAVREYTQSCYETPPARMTTAEVFAYREREKQKHQEWANRMFALNPKGFNGGAVAHSKDGGIWPA